MALALVMTGGALTRYLFASTHPALIGTDAPFHYYYARLVAGGTFDLSTRVSGAWPLLYWSYGLAARVSHISLGFLALWIHPLLNVASIGLFYIYLRSRSSRRVAMLAAYIYTWEYTSFFFGYEFRTQSLAVFLFSLYLAIRTLGHTSTGAWARWSTALTSTACLIAIGLTSLVAGIAIGVLLLVAATGERVGSARGRHSQCYSDTAGLLVLVVMVGYVIFNVTTMHSIVPAIHQLVDSTLALERAGDPALLKGVYEVSFGPFVTLAQWFMRLLFFLALLYEWREWRRRHSVDLGILVATSLLLATVTVATPLGTPLSPGRYYQYLAPFMGLYVSKLIYRAWDSRPSRYVHPPLFLGLALALSAWSISGVMKVPYGLLAPQRDYGHVIYRFDTPELRLATKLGGLLSPRRAYLCADWHSASALFSQTGRFANSTMYTEADRTAGHKITTCISRARSAMSDPIYVAVDSGAIPSTVAPSWRKSLTPIAAAGNLAIYSVR